MTRVDLSINESKSRVDLSTEDKTTGTTWAEATETWGNATGTWARPGTFSTREQKTKNDLSLETK